MCDKCGSDGNAQKGISQKVAEVIEAIRPNLRSHGGDIELVAVDNDHTVRVRLQGACSGCPSARMTLKNGVEAFLKERIPEVKEVVAID